MPLGTSQAGPGPDFERTDPKLLSRMLRLSEEPETWRAEDLAAMLTHQLAADVVADLEAAFPGSGGRVAALTAGAVPPVRTFRELLWHPQPPMDVLRLVKDFAKVQLEGQGMPREVASVFYFGSIGLGLRSGVSISSLSAEKLRDGLLWTAQLPWLDDGVRMWLLALLWVRV